MKGKYSFLIIMVLGWVGCVNQDYFGLSPYANIKSIEVSNQASQAVIDNNNYTVSIEIPPGVDASQLVIQILELSSFATSTSQVGDAIDLTGEVQIEVMAEDKSITAWTIVPFTASSTPQLSNSDFNAWYQTATGYYEPGFDAATTIWGTGNPGTQILGLLATTPIEITDENKAPNMETLYNGNLSETFGAPISAGSVFVGKFNSDNIDPANPAAAIDFGSPFAGRPSSMKINYLYTPGAVNKDKQGNVLDYSDACDIYAYIEVRTAQSIQRLATAWFRSDEIQDNVKTIDQEFIYGKLDASYPAYMKPENGQYVSADSAAFILPTHIVFVATSSYDGANFAGAVGSLLIVDDLELMYKE